MNEAVKPKCSCDATTLYNEEYDSHYCSKCRKWLEKQCEDPSCDYCKDRPKKAPLEGE